MRLYLIGYMGCGKSTVGRKVARFAHLQFVDTDAQVEKAEECGIIKFGSRIDMFFPLDAEIKVKLGDYVKASESVIATLHK